MFTKAVGLLRATLMALLCDKKKGEMTTNPSFAKIAFWLILSKFYANPQDFSQYWFYTVGALLAYILFGTKFLPAWFASRDLPTDYYDTSAYHHNATREDP